jgi:hypothetical protein
VVDSGAKKEGKLETDVEVEEILRISERIEIGDGSSVNENREIAFEGTC